MTINGSTIPGQTIEGQDGIIVTTDPLTGITVIALSVTPPAGLDITFVGHELVAGSGMSWTLAAIPQPDISLQLYQQLPEFGAVLLRAGLDYNLSGSAVTTTQTLAAGALFAWYRYPSTVPQFVGFVDREVLSGTGTAWTLAAVPQPDTSLQLYQELPGFGGVMLIAGIGFTMVGNAVTTTNPIAPGLLTAWYRVPATTQVPTLFVDREVVGGTGTTWTLVSAPSPAASLQLFQRLSGFGDVLLLPAVDYNIIGPAITTMHPLPAGSLVASYRLGAPPPVTGVGTPNELTMVVTVAGSVWNLPLTPTVVVVFRNGLRLSQLAGDYTVSGSSIIFTNGFLPGDVLSALYWL
jgi:hypothetical protein